MKAKAMSMSSIIIIALMAQQEMLLGFGFTAARSKVNTRWRTKKSGTCARGKFKKLSLQRKDEGDAISDINDKAQGSVQTRRDTFKSLTHCLVWPFALQVGVQLNIANMEAQAACLPGDTSIDCIGCYKVPIDDAIRNMIDTPEHLAQYAPGIRWTPPIEYPKSYKLAKDEIIQLQTNLQQDLIPLVSKGDLTSAGILILKIVPRITVTGRFIISSLTNIQEYSMKAFRVEVAHNELLANLGSADILIGQSFAGQLGSITSAQIQILEELNSANQHYEELIKAIPEGYSG